MSEICPTCGEEIDDLNYFELVYSLESESGYKNFCSEECCEAFMTVKNIKVCTLYEIKKCPGYYDCKEIDNLRRKCVVKNQINKSSVWNNPTLNINWCEASTVSLVRANLKLLHFVQDAEKNAEELNSKTLEINENVEELTSDTLKHTKIMTCLTIVMLVVSIFNLILFTLQIFKVI